MRVLVVQHVACEHPGRLADLMAARGIVWGTVRLDAGEAIPPTARYDALMVFGGPMNVYEEERYPWLAEEVRALRQAVDRGRPVLGFCLGAQLLARACGAPVYRAPEPEIGVLPATLTPAGRADGLFHGLPETLQVFQWHGDTFDLPAGAVHLAASAGCVNQAFRVGCAYGLQFHVEVQPAMVDEWAALPEYGLALEQRRGPGAVTRLKAQLTAAGADLERTCEVVLDNFLELVRSTRR